MTRKPEYESLAQRYPFVGGLLLGLALGMTMTLVALLLVGCTTSPAIPLDTPSIASGPSECHLRVLDAAAGQYLPDPACTPGATDPAVTQANIQQTICVRGYTATVRPPVSVTGPLKVKDLAAYGLGYSRTIELDHLISLELGGSSAPENLWPEPNRLGAVSTYNPKDQVENALHDAVCSGQISLAAVQQAIASDWTTALSRLGVR